MEPLPVAEKVALIPLVKPIPKRGRIVVVLR